ncbi:MAG: hypothetical protein QHJ82_05900 [Verrucomicrobiota bacterium]|nr:hypothetical protein [Verrucomicrobiota bacterium]
MLSRITLCALLLFGGSWLLFYAERIQLRINVHHEALKRTSKASRLRLRVTSANYELWLRITGGLMILLFLVLLVDTGMRLEHYR